MSKNRRKQPSPTTSKQSQPRRKAKPSQVDAASTITAASIVNEALASDQPLLLQRLTVAQQQGVVQRTNRLHGNRQAAHLASVLQRHPGHEGGHQLNQAQEEEVSLMADPIMRWSVGPLQRANLLPHNQPGHREGRFCAAIPHGWHGGGGSILG